MSIEENERILNELSEIETFNESDVKEYAIKYDLKETQIRFLIATIVIRRMYK